MKLSEHFSLQEAIISQEATRRGIDNTPSAQIVKNMVETAAGMEQVRDLLGAPIHVNSWFRCLRLNRAIGSSDTSAHIQGYAVDFICPSFGTPKEICESIQKSDIVFDQLINEQNWCHISFAPAKRRNVLTAEFYNGKARYRGGL